MRRQSNDLMTGAICWCVAVLSFVSTSAAQESVRGTKNRRELMNLEAEVFAEINLLRSDPNDYAKRFIAPLQERLVRVPREKDRPFRQFRAYLVGGDDIDYLTLDEGGTEETARALLNETIKALQGSLELTRLERCDVLDRSASFFSNDFLQGGKQRDAHVDSLGRRAGARIGSFGTTQESWDVWQRLVDQLPSNSKTVARVFTQEGRFYWLAYSGRNAYRYWSVPDSLGEFVTKHGEEATLGRLNKPGYECTVSVDRTSRTLHHEDAEVAYPFLLPIYGENVAWGNWSQAMAARGMVCWWLLDPGIQDRGHRKMLLDPEFRYAGVGCARSRRVGWVTTFDASAEKLVPFPTKTQ